MFDDVKNSLPTNSEADSGEQPKTVEDIFSGTEQTESSATDANTNDVANQMTTMPAGYQPLGSSPRSGGRKKILVVLLGIILLGIIGVGGYMAYGYFQERQNAKPEVDTTNETNNEVINTNQEQPVDNNVITNQKIKDTDNDGLSDEEEIQFSTDPTMPDTDSDGLFDREEVYSFKTDPLNPDSDGDGFFDGAEVKTGYDPLGPGRLIDKLPTE